ncbi:hypothetical protein Tco_0635349 [Tanacetum coccineum]
MTFKVLLHHYGSFTSPPGRKYVDGIVATVDPVELNNFSTNQIKAILTKCLGYDENSSTFLYMKKPNRSLDSGLVLLDDAIQDQSKYTKPIFKLIQNLTTCVIFRSGVIPICYITDDEDVKFFVGCASNSTDDGIPNLYWSTTRTQPRVIPRPAVFFKRGDDVKKMSGLIEVGHENVMPTQEYVRKISEDVSEDDHFTLGPWVSAIVYLHGEGVIPSGCLVR